MAIFPDGNQPMFCRVRLDGPLLSLNCRTCDVISLAGLYDASMIADILFKSADDDP